jgi:hypothetical protein
MIASAIVWRIVWKELRQLAPVWAVVLVVSAFVLLSLRQFTEAPIALGLALAFLTAFGGCLTALMLFAMEHDNQTVRFLQHLPQTRRLVVATKIILGLVGTVVLFILVAGVNSILIAYHNFQLWGGRMKWHISFFTKVDERVWLEIALLTGLWGFLIACLTSAVIKRSLPAGLVAMALLGLLAVASFGSSWWDAQAANLLFSEQGERLTSASRIFNFIGLALLFGASLVVGRGWLDSETKDESKGLFRWFSRRKQPSNEFVSTELAVLSGRQRGQRTKLWTVLLWLAMRQSSLSIAIFLIAGIGIAIALQFVPHDAHPFVILYVQFLGPLLALSALSLGAGTEVFWPDQARDTKRFFWQHSLNGRTIWWVRLLPWLAVVFVLTVVFAFANQQFFRLFTEEMMLKEMLTPNNKTTSIFGRLTPEILTGLSTYWRPGSHLLFFGLIALGVGQFFSLLFRNGLVALSCSIIVGPLAIYYVANVVSKGEQAIWFAAPWGLCLFLTSWFLSKSWIDGTLTWRGRTGAIAFLFVAFITQFAAFACHRAFEYPRTDWLEQVKNETVDGDELVSLMKKLYRDIDAKFPSTESISPNDGVLPSPTEALNRYEMARESGQFAPVNQAMVRQIQELVTDGLVLPKDPQVSTNAWAKTCSNLQQILHTEAALAVSRGELREALNCYDAILKIQAFNPFSSTSNVYEEIALALLAWAEHPGQTKELLEEAEIRLMVKQRPGLRAYYLGRSNERVHLAENKNRWLNPFSQPWERERDYRLTQLNLKSYYEHTKRWGLIQSVYGQMHYAATTDLGTTIRHRELMLNKHGRQLASRLDRDLETPVRHREPLLNKHGQQLATPFDLGYLSTQFDLAFRVYDHELRSCPLNVWKVAGETTGRKHFSLDFYRLNIPEFNRSVALEYLKIRLRFQKFWLENKRFPSDAEGEKLLTDLFLQGKVPKMYFYSTNFVRRPNELHRVTDSIPPNQPVLLPQLDMFEERANGWHFSGYYCLLQPNTPKRQWPSSLPWIQTTIFH